METVVNEKLVKDLKIVLNTKGELLDEKSVVRVIELLGTSDYVKNGFGNEFWEAITNLISRLSRNLSYWELNGAVVFAHFNLIELEMAEECTHVKSFSVIQRNEFQEPVTILDITFNGDTLDIGFRGDV